MDFWSLLTDIGILLTASLLLGAILIRLGLNPLIGYLIAGVFLGGPGSIQLVHSPIEIETIAELGVSLLLFSLGLEFSWEKIKSFSKSSIYSGLLQVILTPLIIFGIGLLFNFDLKLVILFALIITLSSTATVLRSLIDLSEIDSPHGRNATIVLLLQDVAVVPFTIIVSLLITSQSNTNEGGILLILASLAMLIAGLYLVIHKLAVPILKLFTLEKNREMSILLAAVISIGSAWAAHKIGISPAIGAFIAGMMLGCSPFTTQITSDISPLRVLFLTLFFGSVGMVADPIWIANNFVLVISLTMLVIVSKAVISFLIFKLTKNTIAVSLASALTISQIGEFAFVLANISKTGNLISEDLHQIVFSVTIMSILITALLIKEAPKIGLFTQNLFTKTPNEQEVNTLTESEEAKIFIFGFGPTGQEVAKILNSETPKNIIVVDLNDASINKAKALGLKAFVGDVRQIEILEHLKIEQCSHVFMTIPSQEAALKAIYNIKYLAPNATIFARSRYQMHEDLFLKAGAQHVISEELTTGALLGKLGLSSLTTDQSQNN